MKRLPYVGLTAMPNARQNGLSTDYQSRDESLWRSTMKPLNRSEEETRNDDLKAIALAILSAAKIAYERGMSRSGFLQLAATAYGSVNEEYGGSR